MTPDVPKDAAAMCACRAANRTACATMIAVANWPPVKQTMIAIQERLVQILAALRVLYVYITSIARLTSTRRRREV